jgi:hypothetical protein
MKLVAIIGAVTTALTITGCSMSNGSPTNFEGTIKKWNTMDNVAHTAARSNWQYRVTEVTNEATGQVVYLYDLKEKLSLFGEMYIRLPEGRYKVKTDCYLSQPSQGREVFLESEFHSLNIKPYEQTRFDVKSKNRQCYTTPFSRVK